MNMKIVSFLQRIISATLILVVFAAVVSPSVNSQRTMAGQSVIIQGADVNQLLQLVEQHGGRVTSRLDIINGVGAVVPAAALQTLQANPLVKAITLNTNVHLADVVRAADQAAPPATDYPEEVGANVAWAQGDLGKGVTVAIIDTGIAQHPGLNKNTAGKPENRVVGWIDLVSSKNVPHDPNGHGTHVAGIIASADKDASGQWEGVAPEVRLVGVRVLDDQGNGSYERVIQGLQWIIQNKDVYNIRVINMSLVSPAQSPYWADPLNQAVMQAWAAGITVVAAAGNGGPNAMSIGVPGNTPYVITVGAFTDNYTPNNWSDDYITEFSAAGPTLDGFVKPDVVAPGAHIVSTMLPGSVIAKNHEANQLAAQYFSMAGTSQATAVVSGVAALVLAKKPNLTPNEVKFRLMVTAFPWVDPDTTEALYSIWQQGYGRVNAPDAAFATDLEGEANAGMDVQADLAGAHYEGYTIYDEATNQFKLRDYESWAGGYGVWSGGYGVWSGGYGVWSGGYGVWSGGYGVWSGGYGVWSGGYGVWSGGYGVWSGGYGVWSGGYGVWSGGYGVWSGGYGVWSGSEPWIGSYVGDASFVETYLLGVSPNASASTTSVGQWVEEP